MKEDGKRKYELAIKTDHSKVFAVSHLIKSSPWVCNGFCILAKLLVSIGILVPH